LSRTEPASAPGGFTLLEVLVAMVLLSVGVVGLQALSIVAIRANHEAGRQTTYVTWLNSQLEETLYSVRYAPDPTQVATGTTCEDGEHGTLCTTVAREVTEDTYQVFTVTIVFEPDFNSSFGLDAPLTVASPAFVPVP
jgi:prepilin-type N-terminal cleavage/methylation domain-containing protein